MFRTLFLISTLMFSPLLFGQLQSSKAVNREANIDISTYSGIIVDHYPNGKPALWKEIENGKANGHWQEWYPDGTLRYNAYWKEGKGHGKWEYYHPNGQLRYELVYQEDIPFGLSREYHENGQLATESSYVDGKLDGPQKKYAPDGSPLTVVNYRKGVKIIDQPQPYLPGTVASKINNEWGITFTPDGNTLYFCRRPAGQKAQKIYVAKRTENGWTEPTVAAFSTDTDETPFISTDGQRFYFASYRPLPDRIPPTKMDMNIWRMDKTPTGWSVPYPLEKSINKVMEAGDEWPKNYETGPVEDPAGNLYYWTKSSNGDDANLFFVPKDTNGKLGEPQEMSRTINGPGFDSGAAVSPDGNYLVYTSYNRSGGMGREDLYYAKKINGEWSQPRNLGPIINTGANEAGPSFSPDGKYLFFSSDRGGLRNDDGDLIWSIYYLETASISVN